MPFWEYELRAETLCLGERMKGGLFRPCDTRTIRYSSITGALRQHFGLADLHAAGYFVDKAGHNRVEYLTYSPRDDLVGVSKLPLTIQFLADVLGRVVVKASADSLPEEFELTMGAMKSEGFGRCRFRRQGFADMETIRGRLLTRIPVDKAQEFQVRVVSPIYGYLFAPTSLASGEYVRSLFEGSEVYGPRCLVKEETA